VSVISPAEAQRRIATAFDGRDWVYDLEIGRLVVADVLQRGSSDLNAIERVVPAEFARKNKATVGEIAKAISDALGDDSIKEEPNSATIIVNDHRHSVNLGPGAQIKNSNVNVGEGTLIEVNDSASKEDMLAAVAAVVHGGLAGDWNADAARDLAEAIDARNDLGVDDIQQITTEVAEASSPSQSRVRQMMTGIATAGLGGALATGISAGLGQVLPHLPL
jgi:hypothetical protein